MGSISENHLDEVANASLPIIDLSPFTCNTATPEQRLRVAQDLVSACRHVGFVYIKNHGVPEDELDQAFSISKRFYALPTDQKMKAPHPPGWAVHRGYSWPGLEKVSNALSENDDEAAANKLREVQDFKVLSIIKSYGRPVVLMFDSRKATKSDQTTTPTNPTCGLQKMSFQNGGPL
jgi:hypothetical protein